MKSELKRTVEYSERKEDHADPRIASHSNLGQSYIIGVIALTSHKVYGSSNDSPMYTCTREL